ncbi:MAG: NAD(P)/FAD-dependent oxidoreductase [Paracoccaceae bacterium]
MPIIKKQYFDAVVLGAGVTGSATAIMLKQAGLSVALVDEKKSLTDYKLMCTHFVQPFANQVFHDIGVSRLLDPDHSVRTKAQFRVPGGQIDTDRGYGSDLVTAYAHNLERRVMDPALRARAKELGVELWFGTRAKKLSDLGDYHAMLVNTPDGPVELLCEHLVAADGRSSWLAGQSDMPVTKTPNERAAYFVYCRGIDAPAKNRSIYSVTDQETSVLYPLIDGRTLLSAYVSRDTSAIWGRGHSAMQHLVSHFKDKMPDISFKDLCADTPVYSYERFDNQVRGPIHADIAFVGDSAVSIDPMSAVGCSFGLKSAQIYVQSILAHKGDRTAGLATYKLGFDAFFAEHIEQISSGSLIERTSGVTANKFAPILADHDLQQQYLDLSARLITPSEFQESYDRSVAWSVETMALQNAA